MMRFRCPNCQQVLEVATPTELMLCPACELWCRIPVTQEYQSNQQTLQRYDEPCLAPSNPEPTSAAITSRRPDDLPLRFRDESEDVSFEILREGEPKRRKRRRRRRFRFPFDWDYWISPSLILFILIVPGGIFFVFFSFLLHPGAGFGAFLWVGGSIWLAFLAVEDGLADALMVVFVPFYSWYYAVSNFERISVPFALRCLGEIVFIVSMATSALRDAENPSLRSANPHISALAAGPITFSPIPVSATAVFRALPIFQATASRAFFPASAGSDPS